MKTLITKIFALGSLLAAASLSLSSCGGDELLEDKPAAAQEPSAQEEAAPDTPVQEPVAEEAAPDAPVLFNDANLEDAVREELEKPAGPVTRENLASLKKFQAIGMGITDLTGLEYATNLTRLVLAGNRITDLTPLAEMTALTGLNLRQNQITDLTPLTKLTKLTALNLSANKISEEQKESFGKALPKCQILF